MINLFKQKEGFVASTFKGLIVNGVEQIPSEIESKILKVDEQTFKDLQDHKLMWKEVVAVIDQPVYEQREVGVEEVEINDLEKPILDKDGQVIGYEKKIENRPIYESVETGEIKQIETKDCVLVENPDYKQYLKELQNEENLKLKQKEIKEIHKWLCDNDWKVNKVFLGEWEITDARWKEYLKERAIKRARLDELEAS